MGRPKKVKEVKEVKDIDVIKARKENWDKRCQLNEAFEIALNEYTSACEYVQTTKKDLEEALEKRFIFERENDWKMNDGDWKLLYKEEEGAE